MIKYPTAPRLGTAESETILRRFTRGGQKHRTDTALGELGRAVRTIFPATTSPPRSCAALHGGLLVVENGLRQHRDFRRQARRPHLAPRPQRSQYASTWQVYSGYVCAGPLLDGSL